MVYGDKKPPPKIATFMEDPVKCSRIAYAWDSWYDLGMRVMMDLPLFCKDKQVDPSAVVLALNAFLTTAEVVKDQASLDNQNA